MQQTGDDGALKESAPTTGQAPLMQRSAGMLPWMLTGGICYTGGVLFYVGKRLPYHHAIWHLFVLAGSICHFIATLIPGKS